MKTLSVIAAASLVSLVSACTLPDNRPVNLGVVATGNQQIPPTTSAGTAQGTISYDRATRQMSWNIPYGGLSGPLQGAAIQGPAAPTQTAAQQIPIPVTHSPLVGTAVLSPVQEADLLAGRMYVNMRTPAFPQGEIRGQIQPGTVANAVPVQPTTPVVVQPAAPVYVQPGAPSVVSTTRNVDGSTTSITRNTDGSTTTTTVRP
jgi:hypothetical protein